MTLRIITADQRLAETKCKTTIALFGPSGVGKTKLLKTLPPEETLCVDLEAGLKSVQSWRGDSISIRTFANAVDIACLIGGVDPAASDGFLSEAHHRYLRETYPDLAARIGGKRIIFVDSERVVDEFNREHWQPHMEGGKAARELPGIVDQLISVSLFEPDGDGWRHEPAKGEVRRLVCRAGNQFGLPAKDRSGRLDSPNRQTSAPCLPRSTASEGA